MRNSITAGALRKVTAFCMAILMVVLCAPVSVSAAGATIKDLANAQTLSPYQTGCPELDDAASAVLKSIIKEDMTQYQKLVAVYNYSVRSFTYDGDPSDNPEIEVLKPCVNGTVGCVEKGAHTTCTFTIYIGEPSTGDGNDTISLPDNTSYLLDRNVIVQAEKVLRTKVGVCDHYAAAFAVLANAVGFETHTITGTIKVGKTWRAHVWNYVKLGENYYIFDPQAEQMNMKDNKIQYYNWALPATSGSYMADSYALELSQSYREYYLKEVLGK